MKMRAFLSFVFVFCAVFVFADGVCRLVVDENGQYTIICEGDGVQISYIEEYRTNHVYVIENCEELKNSLSNSVVSAMDELQLAYDRMDDARSRVSDLQSSGEPYVVSVANALDGDIDSTSDHISNALDWMGKYHDSSEGPYPWSALGMVNSIECGSCTNSSGGGSCCSGVDLEPIIQRLNMGIIQRDVVTNDISIIIQLLRSISSQLTAQEDTLDQARRYRGLFLMDNNSGLFKTIDLYSWWTDEYYDSIANNVLSISFSLAEGVPSINNYLYHIWNYQNSVLTNKITSIDKNLKSFFTLFQNDVVGIPPSLRDWTPSDGSYHDYLTNFYLRVNSGQVLASEMSRTNWFGRIESLLAALVFSDNEEGTNTVDRSYGRDDKDSLNELVSNLGGNMDGHISNIRIGSQNVLSVVRRLSTGFSQATMPSSVVLATIPTGESQTRSSGSYQISFDSSEFSSFIEICRCATTLAWSFLGLLLLVKFSWWAARTSYSLVVFCWGVLSGVFGGKS